MSYNALLLIAVLAGLNGGIMALHWFLGWVGFFPPPDDSMSIPKAKAPERKQSDGSAE